MGLTKDHLVSIQEQASIEAINSNQQEILRPLVINPVYNTAQFKINKGLRNNKYIENQYLLAKKL